MRPLQARLVTLCQQVLALGVVLVVLTPASGVVSLDIVGEAPGAPAAAPAAARPRSCRPPSRRRRCRPTSPRCRSPVPPAASPVSAGRTVAGGATEARVVSTPQPMDAASARSASPGQHGEELEEDQITLRVRTRSGDEWSDWEDLEYHDEHGPDPGSAEAATARPGTEPTFVGDVDDVQVEARTDGVALAGRPLPRPGRPGIRREDRDRGAGRHRRRRTPARRTTTTTRRQDGDRRRDGGHHPAGRAQADRRAAHDLLPRPVGRRREHPQQERAALRHDQRRLRPPHGQRQRLHRGPGAGDHAQHLRLPREVARLERHRLQLPRRPLRSHLGGPLRRHRQARRRRPHAQLQRLLLRDVGHRQLRHRPAARRDAARLRPAVRVEALAARRQPGVDVAEDRPRHVPGDQRPPRRRLDGLPGQVPLRPAAADPDVRLPGRAGGHAAAPADRGAHRRARSAEQPRRLAVPGPRRAARRRRPRPGAADRWPDVLPEAHGRGQEGLGQARRGARLARPHRRRPARPGDVRQVRRGPGAGRQGQRQVRQDHPQAQAARLLADHRRRRHQRRRPQRPRRPLQGPPDHAARDREGRLRPQGHPQGLRQLPADHRRRRRQRRRAGRPAAAHQEPAVPADGLRHRPVRRAQARRRLLERLQPRRRRRLQRGRALRPGRPHVQGQHDADARTRRRHVRRRAGPGHEPQDDALDHRRQHGRRCRCAT